MPQTAGNGVDAQGVARRLPLGVSVFERMRSHLPNSFRPEETVSAKLIRLLSRGGGGQGGGGNGKHV